VLQDVPSKETTLISFWEREVGTFSVVSQFYFFPLYFSGGECSKPDTFFMIKELILIVQILKERWLGI
jgi:hypothetical protein